MFSAKSILLFFGLLLTGLNTVRSQSQVNFKPENSLYNSYNFQIPPLAQDSNKYNKKRVRVVTAANIVGYGGALIALNSIWYSKYARTRFHFFNDDNEWLQMDKVGHVYSAYVESNASMELWRWAGLSRKKRIWIGGLSGVAYQSIIEILDGFSAEYGFSPGDFAANVVGSAVFISQALAWDEQRIKLKFSFHHKNYGSDQLDMRANKLYGKSEAERFIKDYNGQTYWASANLKSFFPESRLPGWLNIAVGYGAEGMFGGTENLATDVNGNVTFDRRDIRRYRQWYLAPDIDLTKMKSKSKVIKVLLFVANSFKFPAPSLEFSKGSFKAHWLSF